MSRKYSVGIVGVTGIAGQQFVVALQRHPWFAIQRLAASARSAGKPSAGGARKSPRRRSSPSPSRTATPSTRGGSTSSSRPPSRRWLGSQEARFAKTTPVVSTASGFRYEADVPLLVPNVNMGHAALLHQQRKNRGWDGFVVPIPNCTVAGLVITLKPLADAFGLRSAIVTSMNGLSGAGRSPGVIGLDILDNIIPFIPKEEEKVETEARKILDSPLAVSATCTRANVMDGHTESVAASLGRQASLDDVTQAFRGVRNEARELGLPSAPPEWIKVHDDPFRPQPRLDRDNGNGMTTTVGRVREDMVLPNGVKYLLVSHHTRMGAAHGLGQPVDEGQRQVQFGEPGIGMEVARWVVTKEPALVGSDTWATKVVPNPNADLAFIVDRDLRVRLRLLAAADEGSHRGHPIAIG